MLINVLQPINYSGKNRIKLKLLIASGAGGGTAKGRIGKYFHLNEFGKALKKIGVEYKLVREFDYITGFPSKNPKGWISKKKFYDLINEFGPDAVFVDLQSHFALETIKAGIPCFVYLRGNIWKEAEWAKETIYKDLKMQTVANLRLKNAERVFTNCQGIFMTADYLEDVIKEHIPNAICYHFLEGLDVSRWHNEKDAFVLSANNRTMMTNFSQVGIGFAPTYFNGKIDKLIELEALGAKDCINANIRLRKSYSLTCEFQKWISPYWGLPTMTYIAMPWDMWTKYIDNIPVNLRPAAICESLLDKADRQKNFIKSITEAGYLVGKV